MTERRTRWPMVRHVEGRARRTQDMMRRLGTDALELVRLRRGEAYDEVLQNCLDCRHGAKCLAWLEHETSLEAVPDFCPNIDIFRQCSQATATPDNDEGSNAQ